jgi:hypothetical protein
LLGGGKGDYPDPSICRYLSYPCAYCLNDFILVNPYHNFESGGAIQREVIERDRKSGEIIKIGIVRGVCVNCAKAMIRLEGKVRFAKSLSSCGFETSYMLKKEGVNYIPLFPMISMNLLSGPNTIVSTLSVPVF